MLSRRTALLAPLAAAAIPLRAAGGKQFGEQLLLSIRYGAWSTVFDPNQAANWARYWRPEIQGYQHAYRAVTGVELRGNAGAPDSTPPSVHLRNRLAAQGRGR